ncbi:MAG: hypothetical protein M1821_003891 [Bathelium mastoideum]|nr:MAG: hypothetical protein M1821_003891 [Bathelium mastoideum]KAI9690969.1 MAG: hypothetical protein M1822_008589 [Bathelium mastoideum]
MGTLCEVCNEQQHKYKCPQCQTLYCSVGCFKTHKQECGIQVKVEKGLKAETDATQFEPLDTSSDAKPVVLQYSSGLSRFAGLENSVELKFLLAKYPNLKSQLKSVWEASQEPVEGQEPVEDSARQLPIARGGRLVYPRQRVRTPWTPEKGHKDMLKRLGELCETEEGVREFMDLISLKYSKHAMGEDTNEDEPEVKIH